MQVIYSLLQVYTIKLYNTCIQYLYNFIEII